MTHSQKRGAALLIAALMVISVVAGGGALAALNYDSTSDGTAESASTSDWTQDTTVTDLGNSSKVATVEVQSGNASNGDNFVLRVDVNEADHSQDNQTVYETAESWTATNSTSGNYELNVTHSSVFEDLERDGDENVTLDVTTVWNESETDEESATIQIHAQNGDDPNLVADNRSEFVDTSGYFSALAVWSDDESVDAAKFEKRVGVNENTTTLTVSENDENVSDALDEATADTASGDFVKQSYVVANGHLLPVFDNSADAEWIDEDEEAYAVDNGDGTITVNNLNETYDEETTGEIDVVVAANAEPSFRDTFSMLRGYGASWSTSVLDADVGQTFDDSGL